MKGSPRELTIAWCYRLTLVDQKQLATQVFTDFGDSALMFKLVFSINNSFEAAIPKSDIRFKIDKKFRENNIQIPFPQRDVHIINHDGA